MDSPAPPAPPADVAAPPAHFGVRPVDWDGRFRYATGALCIGLILLGMFWRFVDLTYPSAFMFDEWHFVSNARNYITGQADWNDHPPLGKLLLIPGILSLGDNGAGWRISSAILGSLLVLVVGRLAWRLFASQRIALFAAAFIAVDGLFISYARSAVLDTPLTLFIFCALLLMVSGRSLVWFALAAVSIGLAVAIKWPGVCVGLLAPWLLWRAGRAPWHAAWMALIAVAVYAAIWIVALEITGKPVSSAGLVQAHVDLLKHHAGFTVWDNAASSRWYTWPFLVHPIVLHHESVGPDAVRATSCVGNPFLWIGTTICMVVALGLMARTAAGKVMGRIFPKAGGASLVAPISMAGTAVVMAVFVVLQLPFILTNRQSYIWHYVGPYGIALIATAAFLSWLEKKSRVGVLAILLVVAAVSIFYAPVWTNAVMSSRGYLLRLPFPGWR